MSSAAIPNRSHNSGVGVRVNDEHRYFLSGFCPRLPGMFRSQSKRTKPGPRYHHPAGVTSAHSEQPYETRIDLPRNPTPKPVQLEPGTGTSRRADSNHLLVRDRQLAASHGWDAGPLGVAAGGLNNDSARIIPSLGCTAALPRRNLFPQCGRKPPAWCPSAKRSREKSLFINHLLMATQMHLNPT
jgi:hypothetical protein